MAKGETRSAADFLPQGRLSLPKLRAAAVTCRGCDLYKDATQTVFGEGPRGAQIMFIGEVPGDIEDRTGQPFVGPAGRLLDKLLVEAGIDRSIVYVTNAVKHFKFEQRGKRRLHGKPSIREIRACHPWLESEIAVVKPEMIVALGATAAQALFGREFRVSRQRGQVMETPWAGWAMATVHPSALLRAPDEAARREGREAFVADLKIAAEHLRKLHAPGRS